MRFPKLKLPLHTTFLQAPERFPRVPDICASLAAGIALLALLGWVSGLRFLAGELGTYIPMAPSTVLAFLLLSGVLFRFAHPPMLRLGRLFALTAISIVLLIGLLVLVQFIFGINFGIERVLSRTNEWLGSMPLGRMSPLTAISFLLEGAAFFILVIGERWRNVSTAGMLLAASATAINTVVIIGYAFGAPLLYGGTNIPVALPTAIAFVLIGVGQFNLAAPGVPELRQWSGASMRGILLRAFLPFLLSFILLDSWVDAAFAPMTKLNPAVWYSLKALVAGTLTVIITGWIARRTGGEIERAQRALAESEALYRSLFENMLSGYAYCQMLFEDGKPQDFIYLDVNDAFEKLTGLKDVTGKRISEIIPGIQESNPELFEMHGRVALTGQSERFETHIPTLGMWFSISVYSPRPGYFVAIFDNITKRKQAEEEAAWLASFPERNPNPVVEIDSLGTVFYMNPAAQRRFPDLKTQGFKHPWLADLGDVIARFQHEGGSELQREIQIGDTWYSQPLYYVPEAARLRVYGTDITERKLAERQTFQMKRLYATLSQVNQAIVRVTSRAELYQTICDVSVKFGEFPLAWIGLLDEATGDVQPVAAKGMDIEQWPFPPLNLHSGPLANGLVATALRTSRVVTSDDLQSDERVQRVQDQIQEHDFHSSASVPFRLRGKTIGALTLISHERDFFEAQQEVHLLDEMGLDISFALDKMETETERRQAEEKVEQQNRRLNVLREIDMAILAADSLENIFQAALAHIRELMGCQRASILLFDWQAKEGQVFDLNTTGETVIPKGGRLPVELFQEMVQTISKNQPLLIDDLSLLPDPMPIYRRLLKEGLRSVCSLPLFSQDSLIGTLNLASEVPSFFAQEKIELGREVANQTAIAITQSRLLEGLRENEERLRLSLQAANQGLYDLNVQTGEAIVNREYAQMLGYDPETFVETNAAWIERLHPDDQDSVAKAYSDYVSGLLPEYKVEFRQRMKDGTWKWILSIGKVIEYDADGKPLRMLGTHTDITERKQAEEEMQSRSRQLTALLDASQSLTESLDRAEVLQKITDKAADVLGVEKTAIYLVEGENLYLGASTPPLPPEFPETLRRAVLADHPHIAEALATRQFVILPDAANATLTASERVASDGLGLRTILYVPLIARQDAVGILIIGTVGKPREFSKNESDISRTLSNQAALTIANAKLYENLSIYVKELESQIAERQRAEEQIQRQLKYLSSLRMIDIAISSSFDLNVILDVVLQQVVSQLGVDASAIMLFNDQLQMTEYAASRGFRSDALRHTRLKLGEGYASQAVLTRKTIHISALMETGSKLAKALQLANEKFVDYYGVPLIAKGEVKGVLEIYQRSYLKADAEWLEFLEALAGQAAIAIDNAQLFENLQRSNLHLEQRVVERTAELHQTNTELEHANRIKDEFLANMSHELRTPLTSILGLSESLLEQRRGSLNDHQEKSLAIIESSGRHLLELINDILDLSKIEAGKFDYYPQPISVDDICRSSLGFVKNQAARKSITITYLQETSLSKIFADPRRLKQILVNLLSNAVKFTLEQGEVILEVKADLEQDLIKFSVIDNGIGIADYDLRRLFQPFVQVDGGLNRLHEGTGLGLALVQKLTDLHGGSIQVESELGKGSRFTVNLPCLQEEVAKLEKHDSQPRPPVRERAESTQAPSEEPAPLTVILLADDNMASVLTIGEYVESHGYEVIVAHDGSEALQRAEASQPDLILMDIQMPVMNGLEAIARLRGNIRFATTPIIALTALAMPGDRERSLLAGANEYMSKPVSLKRLVGTIKELLGKQK